MVQIADFGGHRDTLACQKRAESVCRYPDFIFLGFLKILPPTQPCERSFSAQNGRSVHPYSRHICSPFKSSFTGVRKAKGMGWVCGLLSSKVDPHWCCNQQLDELYALEFALDSIRSVQWPIAPLIGELHMFLNAKARVDLAHQNKGLGRLVYAWLTIGCKANVTSQTFGFVYLWSSRVMRPWKN